MSARAHLAYARQHAHKRFGDDVCADCGQREELALQEFKGRTLCRRCTLLAQGLAPTEDDHPFGRRNGPETAPIDANDHALLTTMQGYWSKTAQQNKNRSRDVRLAAGLRRLDDLIALQQEQNDRVSREIKDMIRRLENAGADSDVMGDESK